MTKLPPGIQRAFRLALTRKGLTDSDLEVELRLHLELRTEQLVASGLSRADAESEAYRRFGGSWNDAIRDLRRSAQNREERVAMRERAESVLYDIRHAMRSLWRAPKFALASILTLALGLGATTVVVSLVDHIVVRPLPYADPDRLFVVREGVGALREVYPTMPANAAHFLEWRNRCAACEGLAAIRRTTATLQRRDGDPQRLGAARVSANLLGLLGVAPLLGRGFTPQEDDPGSDRVAILSHGAWQRHFGGDPGVVGRSVTLNDEPTVVVGVMPPGFAIPGGDALGPLVALPERIEVYRPLALSPREASSGGEYDYAVLARLRAGASPARVTAQLQQVQDELGQRSGDTLDAVLHPLQAQIVGNAGRPLVLLLAAVVTVLLIICVNLTNLTLVREAGRGRESAVRVALGAGRARLARAAVVESLVVAVAGGILGVLLARWGLDALTALAPPSLPRIDEVTVDARIVGAALLAAVISGVGVGLLPALRVAATYPAEALKAGGRTATAGRAAARHRNLFIGAQVAFSTMLLIGAGLFISSFVRVLGVERGFDADRVLTVGFALPPRSYETREQASRFHDRALEALSGIRGTTNVAVASAVPLAGESWVDGVAREADGDRRGSGISANLRFVSPGYFATVGTPLRYGRSFASADRPRRTAVISERTARALWGSTDVIGRRILAGPDGAATEVVGIAADIRTSSLEKEGSLVVYLPSWELAPSQGSFVIRTTGNPTSVATSARAAIRRVDPTVAVPSIRTMGDVVADSVSPRRFQVALLAALAAMALLTASVGIYGVISQSLATRTGEIGVRMALGARPADVRWLVLREGATPVAFGMAAGIGASLMLGGTIAPLLFQVEPGDPGTIATVAALLTTVAVVACIVPARRAARTGVSTLLRLG